MVSTTETDSGASQMKSVESEHWFKKYWRPALSWCYLLTCFTDFVLFPVLWSILQIVGHGQVQTPWVPITLGNGGLFHVTMCTVIGITAHGRTKEKLTNTN
jgi:Holin of 3TMs, for gene-transfer release